MATDSSLPSDLTPERSSVQPAEAALIDTSLRTPLTILIGSALGWLLVASVLGFISAYKLHTPGFLDGHEFMTYGRIQPAQANAFVYGWGFNAAFAVGLWIMARLSRGALPGPGPLLIGALFWNLGVLIGLVGIILGFSTSIEWLEIPGFASPLLLVAYSLIAVWSFVVFRSGRSKSIYASQGYLFAALLAFPWVYSVAQMLLVFFPVRGTVQSIVHAWFTGNLFLVWFGGISLAAIYYFLPKLLLKPVANYYLASLSFWWLVVFGSWAGIARLLGGPVPAWVQTFGAAASFMLVVPLVIIGMNIFGTLAGNWSTLKSSLTLRFVTFGGVAFLVALFVAVIAATQGFASKAQFTYLMTAEVQLTLYGVFTMVACGALYYIVPCVLNTAWASAPLAGLHFGASVLGVIMLVGSLALGGLEQGSLMADAKQPFSAVTAATLPYLFAATVASVVLAIGQLAFALNFFWTLGRAYTPYVRSVQGLLVAQQETAR